MPPDVNVTHVRRWLFCSLRYSAWLANTCFWPVRQSLLSNPILSLQEHAAFLERLTLSSTLTLFSFPSTLGIMVSNDYYYCLVARLSLIDSFSRCRKSIFSRWRPNWCITSLTLNEATCPLPVLSLPIKKECIGQSVNCLSVFRILASLWRIFYHTFHLIWNKKNNGFSQVFVIHALE